jgi:membrane protease subunit HflK
MLTGDQNLLDIALFVALEHPHYAESFLYQLSDSRTRRSAGRGKRHARVVSRVSLNDAMGDRRGEIETQVTETMQRILDGYRSGVLVQGNRDQAGRPARRGQRRFKEVTAAQQDAQSYVNQASAYALQLTHKAQGEATAFDKVYEQYASSPDVTRRRMYYRDDGAGLQGRQDDHRGAG